jgi:hypothetical protein
MEAVSHELALRYLLELSTDIRVALSIEGDGDLVAAAPEAPSHDAARRVIEIARAALTLAEDHETPVEVDVSVGGGAVFLVREGRSTLVCITGPFALPGLILHDMHVVLADLRRGEPEETP